MSDIDKICEQIQQEGWVSNTNAFQAIRRGTLSFFESPDPEHTYRIAICSWEQGDSAIIYFKLRTAPTNQLRILGEPLYDEILHTSLDEFLKFGSEVLLVEALM